LISRPLDTLAAVDSGRKPMPVRIVGAIALAAAMVAVPLAAAGDETAERRATDVETKLRITGSHTNIGPESPAEYDLNGKIKVSPKSDEAKKCKRRRTVTIYFRAPAFPVEEGQTKTNRRGKWFFAGTREASLANGDYFATTPRANRGGLTCSRDTSPDHTIDYDSF
jgi:hypothetical protein